MLGLNFRRDKNKATRHTDKRDGTYTTDEYPILTIGKHPYNSTALLGFIISIVSCATCWSFINFAGIISVIAMFICFTARVQIHKDATQKGMTWANAGIILAFISMLANIVYLILKLGFNII